MYKLTVKGPNIIEPITLSIVMSGNAESIVRGLVHEGFEVTIFDDREMPKKVRISQAKSISHDVYPADGMFED